MLVPRFLLEFILLLLELRVCLCVCVYFKLYAIPLVLLLDIVGNALRFVFAIITSVSENHIVLPKGILFYEIIKAIIMRYGVVRFCSDTECSI